MDEKEREAIYFKAVDATTATYEADREIARSLMTAAHNLLRLAKKNREAAMAEAFRIYRESRQETDDSAHLDAEALDRDRAAYYDAKRNQEEAT